MQPFRAMGAFHRFRPTSHFIAPHSWSNDPCGAVYLPETQEYLLCYQWNPGTTDGGNCAWGMARSKDLITWEDCQPALENGSTYDRKGVFSGSIVSKIVEGQRTLFLFYTSVSALPIHWSKPYIDGCESQSVAISTDYGRSWHRHAANPLLTSPPRGPATTGWRDPFVSQWPSLSTLLAVDPETNYMMTASGERGRGSELHIYKSHDLLGWEYLSPLLDVETDTKISTSSALRWGLNFECASFFTLGQTDYIIVGIEENAESLRHNGHYILWMSGTLTMRDGKLQFDILSHGVLDHGNLYAAHIFRDAQGRLIQLGWTDETATPAVIRDQGWAGCLGHPRELFQLTRPCQDGDHISHGWSYDEASGMMQTLGVRPAPQVAGLRPQQSFSSLEAFRKMRSANFELDAVFNNLDGTEKLCIDFRATHDLAEHTRLLIDLRQAEVTIDRRNSSLTSLGTSNSDTGSFSLLSGEDLRLHLFVDRSVVEVYINDRFAMTSRIYPSQESATHVSYNFGTYDTKHMVLQCWHSLDTVWPNRENECLVRDALHPPEGLREASIHEGAAVLQPVRAA